MCMGWCMCLRIYFFFLFVNTAEAGRMKLEYVSKIGQLNAENDRLTARINQEAKLNEIEVKTLRGIECSVELCSCVCMTV